ncbi:MAG: OmpA family protein [Gammaproteobacteria bacterium]|nr:OmpA family protein [Gammaproteobacteria bacterium]NNC96532.1 OmpA family protein [Gammaproteobacteria bacterium]NNM13036.1 OmpA family protein [Gammaproteobacteria bacterium]
MNKSTKILALGLSALISLNAFAAESNNSDASDWYISPLGSYIKSDQSRLTDDSGYNYRLGLGKAITDNLNLELGLDVNRFDRPSMTDLEQVGLELDALYFFNRDSAISPYLATGIGMFNTSETDDTNASWSAGLGLMTDVAFLDEAKFRTEVRFQQEYDSSDYIHDDVLLRAGVQIPFGASSKAAPKVLDKDSDGDGVNDSDDKCPATPAGTQVNSFGCEIDSDRDGVVDSKDDCPSTKYGLAVDARGCPVDSDGDGVNDANDKCPDTPAGTAVNKMGCPLDGDDDNDGVPNSKDQCPDSAQGVRIDFKGCEIKVVISLPEIYFELNSAKLTSGSLSILDGAVETLNKYQDINAEVAGHTDATGSEKYNLWLSDKRAMAVKEYLISKGIAGSRLTSKGYGESQPIADNSTREGRKANRRVDLNVVK